MPRCDVQQRGIFKSNPMPITIKDLMTNSKMQTVLCLDMARGGYHNQYRSETYPRLTVVKEGTSRSKGKATQHLTTYFVDDVECRTLHDAVNLLNTEPHPKRADMARYREELALCTRYYEKERPMKEVYSMVGMKHRGSVQEVADMRRGTGLTLRRANHNLHDPNAVEVWNQDRHIAFIKATEVQPLAAMMDRQGLRIINGIFTVGADRWPQVEIDSR